MRTDTRKGQRAFLLLWRFHPGKWASLHICSISGHRGLKAQRGEVRECCPSKGPMEGQPRTQNNSGVQENIPENVIPSNGVE